MNEYERGFRDGYNFVFEQQEIDTVTESDVADALKAFNHGKYAKYIDYDGDFFTFTTPNSSYSMDDYLEIILSIDIENEDKVVFIDTYKCFDQHLYLNDMIPYLTGMCHRRIDKELRPAIKQFFELCQDIQNNKVTVNGFKVKLAIPSLRIPKLK